MNFLWIFILAVVFGEKFLMSSSTQFDANDTSELTEKSAKFLDIFDKKVKGTQSMVTSLTTISATSTYFVPTCVVKVETTSSTKYCAILDRRKRREAIFNGQMVHQEYDDDINVELHSGLLEDSRFLQTKSPKFLKVMVKETWTSVHTVTLPQVTYVTSYTPTTVSNAGLTLRTTVFSTIYVKNRNYAAGGIQEC